MRDKRPVDELSIEELERILAIKKREARQQQLQRMKQAGRVVEDSRPAISRPTPDGHKRPTPANEAVSPVIPAVDEPPLVVPTIPLTATPAETLNGHASENSRSNAASAMRSVARFEDDPDDVDDDSARSPRLDNRVAKLFMDRALLLVEIGAVLALVYVAANLFGAVGDLQRETAAAQQIANEQRVASIPTIVPTPTIRLENIVVPGGHIYVEGGSPLFNTAEIPSHLLATVQAQITTPVISRPPKTPETALEVQIPALNVSQGIVQGTDWDALRQGVGQALNGVRPTDREGNVVLAAHNDIYGEIFRDLDDLVPGDVIYVRTETEVITYTVRETIIVEPSEVWVMDNQPGKATVTLISCYPYQVNTERIVVFADRQTAS
ncbi:MAG: sortase [bacterium]|nr:sortase [bacterium]